MADKHNPPKEPLQVVGDMVLGGSRNEAEKTTWPEVVGITSEEAEKKIKEEVRVGIQVHVLPSDSFVTMDFRTDRVRIFTDPSGKVDRPPRIG